MELSDSETFYSLPGSGRKLRVPIKVKQGKVVSPTGVQNFDFDGDCPDGEQMPLRTNPSYMSQEGEETVLLEGNDTEAELEARRIRKLMEDDETTHFTEGLGEEIILPEDSDDEEVNALAEELEGMSDSDENSVENEMSTSEEEKKEDDDIDVKHEMETSEEEKKEEEPSDFEFPATEESVDVGTPVDPSDECKVENAEDDATTDNVDEKQMASEVASEPEVVSEKEELAGDADPKIVATSATGESEVEDKEDMIPEQAENDPSTKVDREGKSLSPCSTNTTEEMQEPDDEENAENEHVAESEVEQSQGTASLDEVPDDEQQTDTETRRAFTTPRNADEESSTTGGRRNELVFAPADGNASNTHYVTASDTDYNTETDYAATTDYGTETDYAATTDYGTETDYGTTDYATSFDYENEGVADGISVNQSVTQSIANSIAVDDKGPRTKKNEKERSKWSLFGCGIVEEVPSTKQDWWNFVLDSTEGALQTVGGNHWDDPWHDDGEEQFDDNFDAYLNRNRSDRRRRRTRSASSGRANPRRPPSRSRRYRRSSSAPRARTTRPKQDRRKQLV